jgi:hypothetical protein
MNLPTDGGITGLVELLETLKKLSKDAKDNFHTVFGRYESASGQMWVEFYHGDAPEMVTIRKGFDEETNVNKVVTLSEALKEYRDVASKGYSLVFKGVTQEDMDKGNAERLQKQSKLHREGLLGTFRNGDNFIRINEFTKGLYYIEIGSKDTTFESLEYGELETLNLVKSYQDSGYSKDGGEKIEKPEFDPVALFGGYN